MRQFLNHKHKNIRTTTHKKTGRHETRADETQEKTNITSEMKTVV